jgi:hypothetical protein
MQEWGRAPSKQVPPGKELQTSRDFHYLGMDCGFFTGKIDTMTKSESSDFRVAFPPFTPEARKANLVDLLRKIASKERHTWPDGRWRGCLPRSSWVVPISGNRKLERLKESLGAAGVELTRDDLDEIESAASQINAREAPERATAEVLTPYLGGEVLADRTTLKWPGFSRGATAFLAWWKGSSCPPQRSH